MHPCNIPAAGGFRSPLLHAARRVGSCALAMTAVTCRAKLANPYMMMMMMIY